MNATDNNRVEDLVSKLKSACEAYYNGDDPIMSDADFDRAKDELVELDPNHPFLKTVGAPVDSGELKKVKHEIPMGSLKKINNSEAEFNTWLGSVKPTTGDNPVLCVNWKLDGSSLELVYRNGEFVQAITRGDGEIGEDVTHTIKNAKGFPRKLNEKIDISVRAEALFRLSDWNKFLNKEGKNPRNACAGTVRRTDGRNSEHIHCVAFNILGVKKWATNKEKLGWLNDNGFEITQTYFVTPDKVKKVVDQTLENRDKIAYEIDGLVVSLDNCEHQDALGEKDGLPYWARAWKFPAMGGFSLLLDVVWDVGTRGTINPVAIVAPVEVGGVTIRNVTLHNMDEIDRLGIQIGDDIEVVRAGDVIPKIVRVVKQGSARQKISCNECPACGSKVYQDGPFMRCSAGDSCEGVLNKRIMKYIKKREIMFLGDSALDKLIESGDVSCVKDLYFLTVGKMVAAGLGEAMSQKILEEIRKSMDVTLSDLIGSLSIDLLGRSEAQNIVDGGFVTLAMWKDMKPSDLIKLGGYQDVKAGRICTSLKTNWDIIEGLAAILNVQEGKIQPKVRPKGSLSGLSFCFTGAANKTRKELQKIVDDNGGIFSDSVDSTLNYLVIADVNSTSSKAVKARKLGTKLITEEQFLKMAGV
jgi:DNA ligase (NAD+)